MGNSGGIIGGVGVGIIGGLKLKLWTEREKGRERETEKGMKMMMSTTCESCITPDIYTLYTAHIYTGECDRS